MKRTRIEDAQFVPRSGSNRVNTNQPTSTGPTIQYQISPGSLKTDSSAIVTLTSPTVQYTTFSAGYRGSGGTTPNLNLPNFGAGATGQIAASAVTNVGQEKFQRLKVEDALSYLDKVKYKFGNQPQVYNDFLDIMKEFKSQSIDTPGVIQRVSNLFKGHPELIVGFNTFLPPGYKIEVQANDQGVAFQVSVSVPSPSGGGTVMGLQQPTSPHKTLSPIVHTIPSATNLITAAPESHSLVQQSQLSPMVAAPPTNVTAAMRDRDRNLSSTSNINTNIGPSDINNQGHNLHHISQAHHSILQAEQTGNQNQPVEFNHAISYVNKIKNRFQHQPEKYKRFLEILHAYQKEQKLPKENCSSVPQNKQLTEAEVYSQVAKLFDQQEDLLREFLQFLPDATSHSTTQLLTKGHSYSDQKKTTTASTGQHSNIKQYSTTTLQRNDRDYQGEKDFHKEKDRDKIHSSGQKFGQNSIQVKRSPPYNTNNFNNFIRDRDGPPPLKRYKPICRDVSLSEASKYGSLNDYAFFDKVRKALRNPEVYENFLRCLTLYNQEIVSKNELIGLVAPFLSKFSELHRWFQDFIGSTSNTECIPLSSTQRQDRTQGELAQEIDLSTCKRLGASYCALPKPSEAKRCSGRTALCKEVLNDTWVSFPTWAEDSTFVTSRKTQYEEIIYRCEDERFELDVVIETNSSTIRVLEGVQKKLSRMTPEEVTKFRLDDKLGGTSETVHQRALKRIYGDKVVDIIQGLKNNPVNAVPIVLRRLKNKEEEWRDAQKGFNKQWREQNEKYYLKSLDHQGINFKQNDIKALRSKSLFHEIETLYDERHEQNEDTNVESASGPHVIVLYKDKSILEDAANLLIHHVKRQTGIQKQEKTKIKHILKQFIPDLFFAPRQPLSDDERDDDDKTPMDEMNSDDTVQPNADSELHESSTLVDKPHDAVKNNTTSNLLDETNHVADSAIKKEICKDDVSGSDLTEGSKINNNGAINNGANIGNFDKSPNNIITKIEIDPNIDIHDSPSPIAMNNHPDEAYSLFHANNNWYLFLRLHAILCERLHNIYKKAQELAIEEAQFRNNRRESAATALRLKPKSNVAIEDYFPTFLDMLKNVLDGNIDSNSFEDSLREMFGIHAYTVFTLDRVITNAVRQLQHCVTERGAIECVELFNQEQRKNATGGYCKTAKKRVAAELAYQRRAETNLQDENCFKIHIYKIDCRLTIELLDTESEDVEKTVATSQTWSNYIDRLANPTASTITNRVEHSSSNTEIKVEKVENTLNLQLQRRPLFLKRNIRKIINIYSRSSTAHTDGILKATCTEIDCNKPKTAVKTFSAILQESTSKNSQFSSNQDNTLTVTDDSFWNQKFPIRIGYSPHDSCYVEDNTEVKISLNSTKMVYIMNKDMLLYKSNTLKNAKKIHPLASRIMFKKLHKYISHWLHANVTEDFSNKCNEWFMGKCPDLIPNVTTVLQNNDITKTPYRLYNRYKVS